MLTVIYSLIDLLIVLLLIYLFRRFFNQVHSVEATVVGRLDESSETIKKSRSIFTSEEKTTSSGYTFCLITFELENGKKLEFHVYDENAEIEVMDKGILTYKGKEFLAFEKYREI